MRCQFDDDVFDQSVGVMSFFEFFFFFWQKNVDH